MKATNLANDLFLQTGKGHFFSTLIFFIILIGAVSLQSAHAQNPFTSGQGSTRSSSPPASVQTTPTERTSDGSGILQRMTAFLPTRMQHFFNEKLSEIMDSGSSNNAKGLTAAALIAFLYGLIHALLPGHRKVLLVSYFAAADAKPRDAIIAGGATAILHAGAGATIVLVAWFILKASVNAALDNASIIVQRITAGIAMAIGLVIIIQKIIEFVTSRRAAVKNTEQASHMHDERPPGKIAQFLSGGKMLPAIVLSATVPCPGSAMILMFALAVGNLMIGLTAVIAFAAGMGTTLIAICLVTVAGKTQFTSKFSHGHFLHEALELIAAAIIIIIGSFWLFASF